MKKAKKTSYIEIDKLDVMDKKIKLLSAKVELREMDDVLKEWSHLFKSSLLDLLRGFESLVDLTSKEVGKNVSYRVGGDDIYLKENIPFYSMRYLLRPGLSGWSQVNYPYGNFSVINLIKGKYDGS